MSFRSQMRGIAFVLLSIATTFAQSSEKSSLAGKPAQSSPSEKPAFDDEPHFAVSGVKDTTNLGGHGSDAIVRARDSLAKDTAALGNGEAKSNVSGSAVSLASLRERAQREPDNAAAHHALADAEEQSGDPVHAVYEYQRAAELQPSEEYLFDWGSELLLHHAPEPSLEVFAKGHRLAPKSARMLIGLGAAEFSLGDNEEAVKQMAAASELHASDATPYLFLGRIAAAETTPSDLLVETLRRFVSLHPDTADASYFYALTLWKRRKDALHANAVAALLNRAIQLDPHHSGAYLQRGILYAEEGADTKAVADYQKAIQIDPKMQDAHYRLAQAYRRIGDEEKARLEIETYEQLAKESERQASRDRGEIRQFVYTLRNPNGSQVP